VGGDPVTSLQDTAKEAYALVEFRFGSQTSPSFYRLTTKRVDVVADGLWIPPAAGVTYASEPRLEIGKIERTGTLEETPTKLLARTALSFIDRLTNGEPHSRVDVTIAEVTRSPVSGSPEQRVVFRGKVATTKRDHDPKKPGVAELSLTTFKDELETPLGGMVSAQCIFAFGGAGCFKDLTLYKQTRTLNSYLGKFVTVSGTTAGPLPGGSPPDDGGTIPNVAYWRNGFVERDGLALRIRSSGASGFELEEEPPADWVGQSVVLTPGCTQLIQRCKEWGQEGNFGGFGIKTPAYQPMFETA